MKFNRVWLRIMQRRFERWLQSLFAPTPIKRTVTVPEYNGWTATQKRLEEESYLANPYAIWLKPDRFETRLWMEGVWERRRIESLGAEMVSARNAEYELCLQKARGYQNAANHRAMLAQLQTYNQLSSLQRQAGYGLNSLSRNFLGPLL